MPTRRSRSRDKGRKGSWSEKQEAPVKQEIAKVVAKVKAEVIDLEEELTEVAPAKAEADVRSTQMRSAYDGAKAKVKRETKLEPREERRAKERKAKVKKERREDEDPQKTRDRDAQRRHPSRSPSCPRRRRKRSRSRSSTSSSSSSSDSESALYRKFKPYTKVTLVNLVRKAELNGMTGQVVHPSTAVSPCPPGCVLVRLETGREIAVRPPNITPLRAFHVGPQQAPQSQEERLQQVLAQIKMNVDNVMERTMALRDGDGSGMLLDSEGAVQGGIGHML